MRTKFEPTPLYSTPCNNCGKLIKDHFEGYCEGQKLEIASPLSDDEIRKAVKDISFGMEYHRAIAIAAKIATIRQVAAMAFDTSLLECNGGKFSAAAMRQLRVPVLPSFSRTCIGRDRRMN